MTLFEKLQEQIKGWRESNYPCEEFLQIKEILNYDKLDGDRLKELSFAVKVETKQDYLGVLNAAFKIAQNYHEEN